MLTIREFCLGCLAVFVALRKSRSSGRQGVVVQINLLESKCHTVPKTMATLIGLLCAVNPHVKVHNLVDSADGHEEQFVIITTSHYRKG